MHVRATPTSRRWLAPLVALGLAVPTTAGALPVPSTPSPGAGVAERPTSTVVDQPVIARPAPAFAAYADRDDPASWAGAFRALSRALGAPAPELREAPDDGLSRYGVPVGDLDGDGRADVLLAEFVPAESFSFRAVAGHDGGTLWTHDLPTADDAVAMPIEDLDGDGAAEILVSGFDVGPTAQRFECDAFGCNGADATAYHYTVTVLDGSTGSERWTRRYDGSRGAGTVLGDQFQDGGDVWAYAFVAADARIEANILAVPMPTGDHDGDGVADVVVNRYDLVVAQTVPAAIVAAPNAFGLISADASATFFATTAEVVSGRDGSLLHERRDPPGPGSSALIAAGDLSGDGVADLLWQTDSWDAAAADICTGGPNGPECTGSPATYEAAVTAIDGATLGDLWTRPLTRGHAVFAIARPVPDLDGDGSDDVLTEEWLRDGAGRRTTALEGTDGGPLWSDVHGDAFTFVIGDVDGGPGTDLVRMRSEYRTTETGFATGSVNERIDGATGASLFETTALPEGEFEGTFIANARILTDVDGDGVVDLTTQIGETGDETGEEAGIVTLESGRTGAIVWESVPAGEVAYVTAALDTDGVGPLEVVTQGWRYDPETDRSWISLTVHDIGTGATRWSTTRPAVGMLAESAGDVDGDGRGDLLLSGIAIHEGAAATRVELRGGGNGLALWGAGAHPREG